MRRCGRTQAHECRFGAKWEQRYCHFVSKAAFPFRSVSHFAGNGRLLEPFAVCALSAGRKAFPLRKETSSLELLTFPLRVKTPSPELCTFLLRKKNGCRWSFCFLGRAQGRLICCTTNQPVALLHGCYLGHVLIDNPHSPRGDGLVFYIVKRTHVRYN